MGELVLKTLAEKGLLEQFSEDAIKWAQQGVEWIEIEGEAFTLISQLEKLKGVEPGDFQKHAGLSEAYPLKRGMVPEAHQRLLSIPGVRRGSIPTTFSVDGAHVLHCGGPGAKAGITAIVRQQRPDWVRAQYLLANMPATLAYLSHGSSKVAKATRDLTIGTTMNVAKAAAEQENAPMAVHQLAGSPQFNALFLQMVDMLGAEARTAQLTAERAELKADHADEKAEKALQLGLTLSQQVLSGKKTRKNIPDKTRKKLRTMWEQYFYGECPCCHKPVSGEQGTLEIDHFWNDSNALENLWLICKQCNHRMGKPGPHRNKQDQQRHSTWLDRCGLAVVQPDIFF